MEKIYSIILFTILSVVLASCGGTNNPEVLPPEVVSPPPTTSLTPLEEYYETAPPSADDATVAGTDENTDGIRDDIENYINLAFSESETAKSFARVIAWQTQKVLLGDYSRGQARNIADYDILTAECLARELDADKYKRTDVLIAEVLNNPQRQREYDKFRVLLAGQALSLPSEARVNEHCQIVLELGR